MSVSGPIEPSRVEEAERVLEGAIVGVKGQGCIQMSHLYLAAFVLLTRTAKSYPFSAGRWVCKELLSPLFLLKHVPDRKPRDCTCPRVATRQRWC